MKTKCFTARCLRWHEVRNDEHMRLILIALLWVASTAEAQVSPPEKPYRANPWRAPFALEAQVGGFGPVGGLGVALEYAPNEYIALSLGAGATIAGWRSGLGVRAGVPVLPRMAIGIEAWYSLGPDRDPLSGFGNSGTTNTWELSHQMRVGFSLEYRSFTGFRFRPFIGAAFLMAESGFVCSATLCGASEPSRRVVPYLGLAIGYAAVRL
ncbi:MAG: hypothetical protein ACI9KE_006770 [Polyangiales bacterium]|jgi:hypothetical protein